MPPRSLVLERNQLLLESAESRAARQVAAAYNSARRELTDTLLSRWTGSKLLTPGQQLDLVRRLGLLANVDAALAKLELEAGLILRDVVTSSTELAIEQIGRELALLPSSLRPDVTNFTMIDRAMIEQFVPLVTDEIQGIARTTALQLTRELQQGLIGGESFPSLVNRLMAAVPNGEGAAVWRNGALSAERMVRRTVVQANNSAKQAALTEINAGGTLTVRKQWVASIGPRTTRTCIALHGQIQDVDKPFDVTHEPRFSRQVMTSPAHWNCRSSIAMWHESFEQGAMPTSKLREDARAELKAREKAAA